MAQTLEKRPDVREYEETLEDMLPMALPLWRESLPISAPKSLAPTAVSRKWRMDWTEIGMIALTVACAVLAIYRLGWAIQP